MASFAASDEFTHPAGPHPYWNESFYMNFFNLAKDWGGATRIGFSPNRGFSDGMICLYFPSGAVGFIRTYEVCADHLGCSRSGPLSHVCEKPFEKWRVRYRGPIYYFEEPSRVGDFFRTAFVELPSKSLDLELEFDPIHEVFDFHESVRRGLIPLRDMAPKLMPSYAAGHLAAGARAMRLLPVMSGARHYEHAGRIRGQIKIDGRASEVNGFGQRDHSWGVRDMRVPANWRWFSGQCGDDFCFNATRVDALCFRAIGGYVFHQGRLALLDKVCLEPQMDESGLWAKRFVLNLKDRAGGHYRIDGEVRENVPIRVPIDGSVCVVNEARAAYSLDGKKFEGISEFMGQIS